MNIGEMIERLTILQSEYGPTLPVYFADESYGEQEVGSLEHRQELPAKDGLAGLPDFYGLPERILVQDIYTD